MASPQRLAAKLYNISPRLLKNVGKRQFLSPTTPVRNTYKQITENQKQISPFNLDTPNRRKILQDGLPDKHGTILGSGAFGTVYKASYKGDHVAVKMMRTEKCFDALSSEKHASSLKHSNIVKVLIIEQGVSLSLIAMELCGPTLQDRLDETALTKFERISILRGVASALQFCHDAGIIHADVKPKNILISTDGLPKLTDFGSSVLIGESNENIKFCGTPGYTAPEVLKGNIPTPLADIYSLGSRPMDDNIDDEFNGAYKALYRAMWSQNIINRPIASKVISMIDTLIA
ncbi:proto-oncogene serine/threonine-protein kinase mos isoform X2 [Megachile rotundata]|uniref:proto-oncogene serine/threonine-protein kinase mos isoform X2 n=1 Tax=Megachile rotundata TaxID=143995 RepID=UPI003FD52B01